jgi:excisionase family DNA binding protein
VTDALTAAQLAVRLGVSTDTVYRKTAAGALPHFRIDGMIRYSWREVYASTHRGPATKEDPDE